MTDESGPVDADSELGGSEAPPSPDPKTAPDGTPIERAASPEQWEEVGRKVLGILLAEREDEVGRAVGELVSAIDYGAPVDEAHLERLRDAIEGLETVVEHDLTDLVEDAAPFERTVGRVPFGRMADALGVETDDLNDALAAGEGDEKVVGDGSGGGSAG